MQTMAEHHESELRQHLQRSTSIQEEYNNFKREESDLREELRLTRARLTGSLQTLHEMEGRATMERNFVEETERDFEAQQYKEKSIAEKQLLDTKRALKELQDDLHQSELKQQEQHDILNIEIQAMEEVNENEVEKAQAKIALVVDRKNDALKEKEGILASLKQKVDTMEKKLTEMRKTELFK